MSGRPVSDRGSLRPYLAMAALALIWGVSFLLIKVAVHDMSPTVLLLLRSASGLLGLAVIVKAMGRPLIGPGWRTRLGSFAFMAGTHPDISPGPLALGGGRISRGPSRLPHSAPAPRAATL